MRWRLKCLFGVFRLFQHSKIIPNKFREHKYILIKCTIYVLAYLEFECRNRQLDSGWCRQTEVYIFVLHFKNSVDEIQGVNRIHERNFKEKIDGSEQKTVEEHILSITACVLRQLSIRICLDLLQILFIFSPKFHVFPFNFSYQIPQFLLYFLHHRNHRVPQHNNVWIIAIMNPNVLGDWLSVIQKVRWT